MPTGENDRVMNPSSSNGLTTLAPTSTSIPISVPDVHTSGSSVTGNNNSNSNISIGTTNRSRRRSQTEGYPTQPLRFLERAHGSAYSSSPNLSTSPYPVGYVAPQSSTRPKALTVQPSTGTPRNSPLAFLERVPRSIPPSISATSLVNGAGVEASLESLREGALAGGSYRGITCSDDDFYDYDEEDDNVCPSIICSCFPCLAFLRPEKRRRQRQQQQLEGERSVVRSDSRIKTISRSLNTPLLSDQAPLTGHRSPPANFPKDLKLIEVEVQLARNVPSAEAVAGMGDFGVLVGLRMTPVQEGVGEQAEQTSMSTRPFNPRWGARETFTFFVTDSNNNNARVFLQLHLLYRPLRPSISSLHPSSNFPRTTTSASRHLGSVSENSIAGGSILPPGSRPGDIPVGEGFVDVLGLFPLHDETYTPRGSKGNSRKVTVPMRDPVGKRRIKCSVMLALRCRRVNETIDTLEDRLYEYQKWTDIAGWGLTGASREGKWSTVDGASVGDSFIEVAPPAGDDSQVVLPWCPLGGWEYSRLEHWETLGLALRDAVWTEGYVSGARVIRRRLWRRIFLDNATSASPRQETI